MCGSWRRGSSTHGGALELTCSRRRPYRRGVSDDSADALPDDPLPPFVRGLLDPAAYPHQPPDIRLVQTHISYVFLAGDLVYKAKKPVDFGFIDQVAPETREAFCHAEVRLNRRLAPDVYLDVVPIVRTSEGGYAVEAEGEVVEWAVKMRRLPEDRTLEALLGAHREPPDIGERLVEALLAFHREAGRVPDDPAFAGAEAERGWWAREYGEAAGFIGSTWRPVDAERTRTFIDRTLEAQAPLFDERLGAGRVVEGHGDLLTKHVYVLGPRREDLMIVDCIEFTEWFHFRYLDAGYDIAFLAMDLEAAGHPGLGDEVAGRYIAAAGDETMGVLQPLHRAFRAFVRGKVESIGANASEVDADQRRALGESAARYFALAAEYTRRATAPCLVVLCGLSGTGKSTVGGTVAGRIGAALVASDSVRRELADAKSLSTSMWQRYEAGAYSAEMDERTYASMREHARRHLAAGRPVILDATHRRADDRRAAIEVAREAGVPALIVELRLTDDAALTRLINRERLRGVEVQAGAFRQHVTSFDAVSPAEGRYLALDASQTPAALAAEIAESLPAAD
ncbi:MAG: AAA family ATPase [Dehalococcoidia bacterium]|nr:AAA family ATPase [Dehalococcoidia bacterium]